MHPDLKEAQELINNIAANCHFELQQVSNILKELTDKGEISSFSFRDNNRHGDLFNDKNHIMVEIDTPVRNRLLLGFGDLVGFDTTGLSSSTLEKLEGVAEYLDFMNTHCVHDLPRITQKTYYSKNADQNLEYWKNHNVQILPDFEQKPVELMKPKM